MVNPVDLDAGVGVVWVGRCLGFGDVGLMVKSYRFQRLASFELG